MIICIPVVERDANIEFIIAEVSLVIIVKTYDIKVFGIELQMLFKRFQFKKNRIEPGVICKTYAMIDQYPAPSRVPVKFFIKTR